MYNISTKQIQHWAHNIGNVCSPPRGNIRVHLEMAGGMFRNLNVTSRRFTLEGETLCLYQSQSRHKCRLD